MVRPAMLTSREDGDELVATSVATSRNVWNYRDWRKTMMPYLKWLFMEKCACEVTTSAAARGEIGVMYG